MPWVDSHCHLQGADDLLGMLGRARAAGVDHLVCVGTDLASSRRAVELASSHETVSAVVGLHPHDARHFEEQWDGLVELSDQPEVVGVGETGFDLHYRHSPEPAQERSFRAHIRLARERGLPLVIHSREAWPETFGVLESEGLPEPTVFHCFTGGAEQAQRAVGLGAHLSFSGIVSFPNAAQVQEAAATVPGDHLLVETDTPFLAPVPYRGRANEPAWVVAVGQALARVRGCSPAEIEALTTATAKRVFRL